MNMHQPTQQQPNPINGEKNMHKYMIEQLADTETTYAHTSQYCMQGAHLGSSCQCHGEHYSYKSTLAEIREGLAAQLAGAVEADLPNTTVMLRDGQYWDNDYVGLGEFSECPTTSGVVMQYLGDGMVAPSAYLELYDEDGNEIWTIDLDDHPDVAVKTEEIGD